MVTEACSGSDDPRSPALARVRLTETAGDAAECTEVTALAAASPATPDAADAGVIEPNTIAPTLRARTTTRDGCFTG
jgi:hypothetical protein